MEKELTKLGFTLEEDYDNLGSEGIVDLCYWIKTRKDYEIHGKPINDLFEGYICFHHNGDRIPLECTIKELKQLDKIFLYE